MLTTPDSPIMFMAFCKKMDHTHNSYLDQKSTLTKAMGQGPKLLISQRINFDRFAYLQESLIHVGLQAPDPKSPDSAAYSHPTGF